VIRRVCNCGWLTVPAECSAEPLARPHSVGLCYPSPVRRLPAEYCMPGSPVIYATNDCLYVGFALVCVLHSVVWQWFTPRRCVISQESTDPINTAAEATCLHFKCLTSLHVCTARKGLLVCFYAVLLGFGSLVMIPWGSKCVEISTVMC
jgi:hypothetical protein